MLRIGDYIAFSSGAVVINSAQSLTVNGAQERRLASGQGAKLSNILRVLTRVGRMVTGRQCCMPRSICLVGIASWT